MISVNRGRIADTVRAAAPLAILALAVTVLLIYPPAQNSFYPQCPIHEYLHLQCPGCGATRALAALLHGNLAEAVHFNALVPLLFPFAIAYSSLCYRRFLKRKPLRWPQPTPTMLYITFALVGFFTVIRNLPLHSL